jgi:hypothetical protein
MRIEYFHFASYTFDQVIYFKRVLDIQASEFGLSLPKKGIDDNQLICCDWVVGQRRFR